MLKLKHVENVGVSIAGEGKVCIKQYSLELGHNVYVYLTLDQFIKIYNFVVENENDLKILWNDGVVEDEYE